MQYDVIIIGGGLAGYSAGLRCLEKGLNTALLSSGQSALHFASGSIDLLSQEPNGTRVQSPLSAIEQFPTRYPKHPYGKIGRQMVLESMSWFQTMMADAGVSLQVQPHQQNHLRITPLGGLMPTWMSPSDVHQVALKKPKTRDLQIQELALEQRPNDQAIVVVEIAGFRDFQAELLADNLRQQPEFASQTIRVARLDLRRHGSSSTVQPSLLGLRNIDQCRSMDLAEYLKRPDIFASLCEQLTEIANSKELVLLPAIFDHQQGEALLTTLRAATQLELCEVTTMPPSLMGIRIEHGLSQCFIQQGGTLLKGDRATHGQFLNRSNGDAIKLSHIHSRNLTDFPISASHYILASGSFFSQGLTATQEAIIEPLFGLDICKTPARSSWSNSQFFSSSSHPYLAFGVETDSLFRPSIGGETISNLYCAGAILAHYDPIAEGNGGGVAIASAYTVVESIARDIAYVSQPAHTTKHSSKPLEAEQ